MSPEPPLGPLAGEQRKELLGVRELPRIHKYVVCMRVAPPRGNGRVFVLAVNAEDSQKGADVFGFRLGGYDAEKDKAHSSQAISVHRSNAVRHTPAPVFGNVPWPQYTRRRVRVTSIFLAVASLAAFLGTMVWAYKTSSFWETVPAFPCIVVTGFLAAAAAYAWRERFGLAVFIGIAVGCGAFVSSLIITLGRWAGGVRVSPSPPPSPGFFR